MRSIIWRPSPNFSAREDRASTILVIHSTGSGPGADGDIDWMCTPKPKNLNPVSAHYCIDRLGGIFQLVYEKDVAWHAGDSVWKGPGVNSRSIGIELDNLNDGKDPYPAAQLEALTELVKDIRKRHPIALADVVRHADIALPAGRKTDPAGFPWESWKASLEG